MYKWIILLVIICIICIAEWMREIRTFKMTHYDLESKKLQGLKNKKIILLSDLHNYTYGSNNEKLLAAIRKERPDLILIAGDMLVGKAGVSTEVALDFCKALTEICDVYYANGNHEQRMKEYTETYGFVYQEYKEKLVSAGIHYLENTMESFEMDGYSMNIYGLEIPCEAYKKFKKVILEETCLEDRLGSCDLKQYNVLIAHNPVFMKDYLKWGADLIVSGHLHGGVARIPGFRGVITPQGGLFPKYSGELRREGDSFVAVSKGIGIHTIKVRFLNPAEVVVLHLNRTGE